MFSHMLFDLDGTLIDSKRGIFNAVRYTLNKLGIAQSSWPADFNPFIGPPLRDSFRELFNFSPDMAEKATVIYREYYGNQGLYEFDVYEGIATVLPQLHQSGKTICLVTSKAEVYARKMIASTSFASCFVEISGCEIDGTRSHKHELINYTLNKLSMEPDEKILMIGDRYHDIRGAKLAGISSAAVLYGYGSEEELREESPTLFIRKPDDLLAL